VQIGLCEDVSVAPKVHYTRRGDLHIAYAVIGDGPIDVVFVPGFLSHLNRTLDPASWATAATWFERLARFARVITFDKIGTGLSDRSTDIPGLEDRMDDVRAVMDAVGSEQAALVGVSEGGPMCILFAATFPERVHSLTLYGACATFHLTDDHPWSATAEDAAARRDLVHEYWGTGLCLATLLPPGEVTDDNIDAFGEAEVACASPGAVARLMEMSGLIDVRSVLPAISVPTLVVHATSDNSVPFASGEYLAQHIPGARFFPIEFNAHLSVLQTTGAIVDWVDDFEEFVTGVRPFGFTDRVLATVLYTDIVGSTARASALGDASWKQLLDRHDRLVEREIGRHRGVLVKSTGDGVLARFDGPARPGPARAVSYSLAIADAAPELGLEVRAGLHTGEIELRGDDIGGISAHVGARVAALAGPHEVFVSRTVRDLVAGSGLCFTDRGEHELKGVPDRLQIYAASRGFVANSLAWTPSCRVQPECLDYARADSDTMGFWGGTSDRERRDHGAVA
jgi:class 3 adenylate cyclase/pimeloyl-ACP methyl ester carboxylesterase